MPGHEKPGGFITLSHIQELKQASSGFDSDELACLISGPMPCNFSLHCDYASRNSPSITSPSSSGPLSELPLPFMPAPFVPGA